MPEGLNTVSSPLVQTGRTYADRPMVRRITNAEIDEKERLEREQSSFAEKQNQPVVSRMASHIRSAFTIAVSAKSIVMQRMLKCLRQREGIYEADIKQMIAEQNGTNIYMMITDVKCRALESWLKDVMLPSGEKPYKVKPTPVPDIPPHLVQKAQQVFMMDYLSRVAAQAGTDVTMIEKNQINEDDLREAAEKFKDELLKQIKEQATADADTIEQYIDDELVEGKWYEALNDFIEDFATYPTAFMEGPIFRRRTVLEWKPIPNTQMSEIGITEKIVKEYDRVDPFDVYPAPGAKTIQDGDLCIRKRYTRRDLEALRGIEGFDTNAINQVLQQYQNGYREFISYDTEIADLHDRPNESSDPEGHIDGIKFFGSVNGFTLREWGMKIEDVPDPFREYSVIAYVVGSYVVGARLNPHPLGRRNLYSASFRHKNGSIWGRAVPETMRDVANLCNSAARALCNNSAMASGPQVWQLVDLIPPECNRTEMFPWKIWEYSSEKLKTGAQQPMGFFQPQLIVNELLNLYKYFFEQGSEVTGIPAYIYGNQNIGGAGATASGLSMLMNAAAKGLRNAASNIDKGVISRSVEEHWLVLMLTRPDLAKGDCRIVARASEYLIQAEQNQMRIAEALSATNNPTDMAIMGIDGRAELLKANFKRLNISTDKLIPRREDMIASKVEQEVQNIIMKLSQALQIPPEQLVAVLQQPPPGAGRGRVLAERPQELGPDGNPMAGKDVRLFNQGGGLANG